MLYVFYFVQNGQSAAKPRIAERSTTRELNSRRAQAIGARKGKYVNDMYTVNSCVFFMLKNVVILL